MEATVIKIILSIIFSLSIVGKMTGKTKSTFEKAGYSLTVMYVIAFGEALLVIGLFTQYEIFATIGLLGIMSGAVFTLFRQKAEAVKYILPMITVVLLIGLLVLQIPKSSFPGCNTMM